jgi:hypothetical protein
MKDVRFIWGLPQEDSFMKLKELVTSAHVLVLPNNDLPFRLEVNGSSIATGMVLSHYDTEMLAIIRGLEEWRHYLEGARHPVEIRTDHKNYQIVDKLDGHFTCLTLTLRFTTSQAEAWVSPTHSPDGLTTDLGKDTTIT